MLTDAPAMLPRHAQAGDLLLPPTTARPSQWRGRSFIADALFREAQWLAARLDAEFARIIVSVKDNTKTPDIPRIAREYLKSKLEQDMDERAASPHIGVCGRSAEPGRIVADDLEWIDGELETARTGLRERLYEHQRPLIDWVMEHTRYPRSCGGPSPTPSFRPTLRSGRRLASGPSATFRTDTESLTRFTLFLRKLPRLPSLALGFPKCIRRAGDLLLHPYRGVASLLAGCK